MIASIAELNGKDLSDDKINRMDYFERCTYLNLNYVPLARPFSISC